MGRYLLRRLAQSILVVLGVSVLVFLLVRSIPGDPARLYLPPSASDEQVAQLRRELGLEQPLPVQYAHFLLRALHGDLGNSLYYGAPAAQVVMEKFPATLLLATSALVIAVGIGAPLGILSAVRRGSPLDYVAMALAIVGQSMPAFWLGLMLILVFAVNLRLLPTSGMHSPQSLFLPAFTLGAYVMSLIARLVRAGMLDVLSEDYVRTARAKGLAERAVLVGHALRNTLIPVITVVGLQLGTLLGGAVITETVFSWPGVGTVVVTAISSRDYAVVQAVVLMISVVFVFLNLAVDLLYAYVDPRIRYA